MTQQAAQPAIARYQDRPPVMRRANQSRDECEQAKLREESLIASIASQTEWLADCKFRQGEFRLAANLSKLDANREKYEACASAYAAIDEPLCDCPETGETPIKNSIGIVYVEADKKEVDIVACAACQRTFALSIR